jgi:hypothetical protein
LIALYEFGIIVSVIGTRKKSGEETEMEEAKG